MTYRKPKRLHILLADIKHNRQIPFRYHPCHLSSFIPCQSLSRINQFRQFPFQNPNQMDQSRRRLRSIQPNPPLSPSRLSRNMNSSISFNDMPPHKIRSYTSNNNLRPAFSISRPKPDT